jgi:hypothetical protein
LAGQIPERPASTSLEVLFFERVPSYAADLAIQPKQKELKMI